LFWAAIDLRSLAVLLCTTLWVWFICNKLNESREKPHRRLLRNVGVSGVVVVLLGWRAVPGVLETLEQIGVLNVWRESFWQPLGVAILAIQAISTIIDVERRDAEAPRLVETVLLCGFFPRALAGPVVRSQKFIGDLRSSWDGRVPIEKIAVLVLQAAVKKYILAETLFAHAAQVTAVRSTEGRFDLIASMFSGSLAYVCDLSAYTDMAIAAALVCGMKLPENFNAPYSAWSVGEFMRRWHMSISGFFRDYVLTMLRGNSRSSVRLWFAVIGTFELIALWHNVSMTTMVWGVLVGVPVAYEAVREQRRALRREPRRVPPQGLRRFFQAGLVGCYFAAASVMFPADDIRQSAKVLFENVRHDWWATDVTTIWVVAVIAVAWLNGAGLFAGLGRRLEQVFSRMPGFLVGATCALCVTFCAGLAGGGIPTFLYQRL
jgi:D-alanyl-lipoteichoic acid acyltransferase DltB (MBOAT superfamily)